LRPERCAHQGRCSSERCGRFKLICCQPRTDARPTREPVRSGAPATRTPATPHYWTTHPYPFHRSLHDPRCVSGRPHGPRVAYTSPVRATLRSDFNEFATSADRPPQSAVGLFLRVIVLPRLQAVPTPASQPSAAHNDAPLGRVTGSQHTPNRRSACPPRTYPIAA